MPVSPQEHLFFYYLFTWRKDEVTLPNVYFTVVRFSRPPLHFAKYPSFILKNCLFVWSIGLDSHQRCFYVTVLQTATLATGLPTEYLPDKTWTCIVSIPNRVPEPIRLLVVLFHLFLASWLDVAELNRLLNFHRVPCITTYTNAHIIFTSYFFGCRSGTRTHGGLSPTD